MERVAWITGAGRGLGRALVHKLRGEGVRVAACSRTPDDLARLAPGDDGLFWRAFDVGDAGAVASFAAEIVARWGRLDIVVNNAGIGWYKPFLDHSPAEIGAILRTNLEGPLYVAHAALPHLIAHKGHLINVASDLARRPLANMVPYVASKHGVLGFSASLLREVKSKGVKVTTFLPGIIDTGFGDSTPDSRDETWSMRPEVLADLLWSALNQPGHLVLDELAAHPLHQDF
ncbi:MAG: SDR family oxidoreductase [Myxococcales bacterium]|nr:SDR family oxidoreductase [Myxococcales bacterium]